MPKKISMRKDIVSGQLYPQKDLIRIVKNKNDDIFIDKKGRQNGRGAYISINKKAVQQVKKHHLLDKVFKLKVSDEFYDELIKYVDHKLARMKLFGNKSDE